MCRLKEEDASSLAQHLSAMAPLAPHIRELSLECGDARALDMDTDTAAALISTFPSLRCLSLSSFQQPPLAAAVLLQLVLGLPGLQHLHLSMRVSGPEALVVAATAAEQQVLVGRRAQGLVIELSAMSRGPEEPEDDSEDEGAEWERPVVPGVRAAESAAAVNRMLAQGGWQLSHVEVVQ